MIYDCGVRRVLSVCLIALAFGLSTGAATAQVTTTTAPPESTTTSAPPRTTIPQTSTTTAAPRATTTTVRSSTTTSTTTANRRPVPPPAAGPTQTLVPDLLGTGVSIQTTSTLPLTPSIPSTLPAATQTAAPIAATKTSPSGATLVLAAIAWLASLGGLLVYVEDQRSRRWRHLAR